jgi:hypothetical protein
MWNLAANELAQLTKGSGGQRFMEFVDRLIRVEVTVAGGVAQSEILTQLRANIGDSGVDTQVNLALPLDATGWFDVPTLLAIQIRRRIKRFQAQRRNS